MIQKTHKALTALVTAIVLLCSSLPLSVRAEAKEIPVVSYGIQVLSALTDVALCAPVGNEIVFSKDALMRALNLSDIKSVTFLSLPNEAAGEMKLASTKVAKGQTLNGENLPYLTFTPADGSVRQASFLFSVNEVGTIFTCNLYWMEKTNTSPTVEKAPELSLAVETYRDMEADGRLFATDSENDELSFEIVTVPKSGAIWLSDPKNGYYVYQPSEGYVGSDSFSYVARDKFGNYSAAKEVTLQVRQSGISLKYQDVTDPNQTVAAIAVTDAGIMSGTQVGDLWYFYPEKEVSRIDFLVMSLRAAGVTDIPTVEKTSFEDDAEIPREKKGYAELAKSMGLIGDTDSEDAGTLEPNEPISKADAAWLVCLELGLFTQTQSEGTLEAEKTAAVETLRRLGLLEEEESGDLPLSRAEAAKLFGALSRGK